MSNRQHHSIADTKKAAGVGGGFYYYSIKY